MIDYNQPWGWVTPGKKQQSQGNMVAPLGGGNVEGAPTPIQAGPSTEDKLIGQMKGVLANQAVDGAAKGLGEYMSGTAAPVAASAGDTLVGGIGNAAEMTGNVSDAASAAGTASSGLSVLGPLGAAMSGAMKGEYDQAAGAALGSALGSTFGPLGAMVGSKLGGYAGDAVGGLFGLADGTTKVPDEKKSVVQSIWDKLVEKGADAVKTSTGNQGALGQAKQALATRKERLDAEERKAVGYAWGTTNAGGKGFPAPELGAAAAPPPQAADTQARAGAGSTVLNRPWGSTAATGYYGDRAQSSSAAPVTYRPHGFTTSLRPQAAPIVQNNTGAPWSDGADTAEGKIVRLLSSGGGGGGK